MRCPESGFAARQNIKKALKTKLLNNEVLYSAGCFNAGLSTDEEPSSFSTCVGSGAGRASKMNFSKTSAWGKKC
jgi:hypothetical protein